MFGRIARRYDLLNTAMTAGRHHAWRRIAADEAVGTLSGPALDVATGTGDLALELARSPRVTGVVGLDFAPAMLSIAGRKTLRRGWADAVSYIVGDAHDLPFPDGSFVCATVGFGIRNFIDVPRAMREMVRVTMPGGRVAVLEIVRMERRGPAGRLFPLYFRYVAPWLGAVLAGDREAYTYLPESVERFMESKGLATAMREAGLTEVKVRRLALGSIAIVVGHKPR